MSAEFRQKLGERVAEASLTIEPDHMARLEQYFDVLSHWNARINLTALPLDGCPIASLDRLFVEPIAAAGHFSDAPLAWVDIGSGGGSPAVPLKILRPLARLTLVESRGRKAAFLREVIRVLELKQADVFEDRFEKLEVASSSPRGSDLLTLRAVRVDSGLLQLMRNHLAKGGNALIFQTAQVGSAQPSEGLKRVSAVPLAPTSAFLEIFEAV